MLQHIPTHVIAGPLGAGKTSVIKQLLAQKPQGERWAVLINEFGQIGLDAALLTQDEEGVALGEVAGGCLCCVNGAPFQIGLGRLLRKAQPDRLFIEPSGLGHPAQIIKQLGAAPWLGVLALQPCVMVLDAQALALGKLLPDAQQEALGSAGLLVLNKAEQLRDVDRQRILDTLPTSALYWTEQGMLPFSALPGWQTQGDGRADKLAVPFPFPESPLMPGDSVCEIHAQASGWSIGWRWHPDQQFLLPAIEKWLSELPFCRAKVVIHSREGWVSGNFVDHFSRQWRPSEWRRDSRLELIFTVAQDSDWLQQGLAACRSETAQ